MAKFSVNLQSCPVESLISAMHQFTNKNKLLSSSGWSSWRRISGMDSSTYCMRWGSSFFRKWFLGGNNSSFWRFIFLYVVLYVLIKSIFGKFEQFLTRTVWWAIPTIWLPVVCYVLSISARKGLTFPQIGLIVAFGVLTWTLLEYTLHRFLFHIETKSYWLVQYPCWCKIENRLSSQLILFHFKPFFFL